MMRGLFGAPGTPEVDQAELTDLHLVTVPQQAFVDQVPVHVRAVETAHILDLGSLRSTGERGVAAGHRDVVEKDVGILMPPGRDDIGVEQKSAASIRTPLNDQQR